MSTLAVPPDLGELLVEQIYLRERTAPRPGDTFYLLLADLALALRRHTTEAQIRLLDFGCGGSPYRSWFPNATYLRADLPDIRGIDHVIAGDGRVDAPSESFDFVLSTQVLEHCPDPAVYLDECYRVLKPGGKLLASTHGVFEDHGCPYDFQRWTAFGLERDMRRAGFTVESSVKLTTAGRAMAFMLDHHGLRSEGSKRTLAGLHYRLVRKLALIGGRAFYHRCCDRAFQDCQVVDASAPGHGIYVGLMVHATRPLR